MRRERRWLAELSSYIRYLGTRTRKLRGTFISNIILKQRFLYYEGISHARALLCRADYWEVIEELEVFTTSIYWRNKMSDYKLWRQS